MTDVALEREPTLRSLFPSVYLPTLIFAMGQGAVIPVIALAAREIGASIAAAGAVAALPGIGTMVFDVPAGKLVSRLGERAAMAWGTGLMIVSLVGCVFSSHVALFGAFMFLMGCASAVWLLARYNYLSEVLPATLRGRALSALGGTQRIGNFVGPFLGALAIGVWGVSGAFYVNIALAVVGCTVLILIREPGKLGPAPAHVSLSLVSLVRTHRRTFLTAGVVALTTNGLRSTRQVLIPLWGVHIGLDAQAVSVVFGIAAALDMTLFYPVGLLSDRKGRRPVAFACLGLMACAMALLPLTRGFTSLLLVTLLSAFGNGLGSGIVLTLGSDFAPDEGRPQFLGAWRLVSDSGAAGGPLVVAAVETALSLAAAAVAVAGLGVIGLVVLLRMPEPLHRRGDRRPTAAG